jgi:hypothetical protein
MSANMTTPSNQSTAVLCTVSPSDPLATAAAQKSETTKEYWTRYKQQLTDLSLSAESTARKILRSYGHYLNLEYVAELRQLGMNDDAPNEQRNTIVGDLDSFTQKSPTLIHAVGKSSPRLHVVM